VRAGLVVKALLAVFILTVWIGQTPAFAQANPDNGDVTSGLVGHWKLDETSGTNIIDYASNNDGTVQGGLDPSTASVDGAIGQGLQLQRSSGDYIALGPDNTGLLGSALGSISLWFKTNGGAADVQTLWYAADECGGGFGNENELHIHLAPTNNLGFFINGSGSVSFSAPQEVNDNRWRHIVAIWDISGEASIYIDAQLAADATHGANEFLFGADMRIGATCNDTSRNFNGAIDDVRIYNRALSADDVALLYRSFPGEKPCNADYEAVLWFNHDEGVMQYCNGTDWISIGKDPGNAMVTGCPNIGDICDDGSFFAGTTPDDGVSRMYVTSADLPGTYSFNDGTNNHLDSTLGNCNAGSTNPECRTGESNTNTLVSIDSATTTAGIEPHNAALACFCLGESHASAPDSSIPPVCVGDPVGSNTVDGHGYDDWYLPSLAEMDDVYVNLVSPSDPDNPTYADGAGGGGAIGALDGPQAATFSGIYWTSSELGVSQAYMLNFTSGNHYTIAPNGKGPDFKVRCVRKNPAPNRTGCTSPTGKAGEITYNRDFAVFQYCNGSEWVNMSPPVCPGGNGCFACDYAAGGPNCGNEPRNCPDIGDVCLDGSIYAGTSPDGGLPMYTTPGETTGLSWGSYGIDRGVSGGVTGEAHTETLAGFGAAAHPAAHYCYSLPDLGHNDWYLPSQQELQELSSNRVAIGVMTNDTYWSSNESANPNFGRRVHIGSGVSSSRTKNDSSMLVRCIRRHDPSETTGAIDLDFANNRYVINGQSYTDILSVPGLTYTRAGPAVAYAEDKAGNLVSFPANTPRITDKGYLAEWDATNVTLYSQELDFDSGSAGWGQNGIDVIANATTAPDGTTTAEKIFETATTEPRIIRSRGGYVVPPNDIVVSAYVKAAEKDRVVIGARSSGVMAGGVVINLNDGSQQGTWARSPGNVVCQRMSSRRLANDWWHIQVFCRNATNQALGMAAIVSLTDTTSGNVINESYTGDGVSGVYVWGVQMQSVIEDIPRYGTSYIPTTSAPVTRPRDIMRLDGAGWYNHEEGTFLASGTVMTEDGTASGSSVLSPSSSTDNNSFWEPLRFNNRLTLDTWDSPQGLPLEYQDMHNKSFVAGYTYASDYSDNQGSVDGILGNLSSPYGDLMANPVGHIGIGLSVRAVTNRDAFGGYIRGLHYRPVALPDAQLQTATQAAMNISSASRCVHPDGAFGEIVYNDASRMLQGCTPHGWVVME